MEYCHIQILKLQHHAATLTTLAQSIAHLLQQRSDRQAQPTNRTPGAMRFCEQGEQGMQGRQGETNK